MEEVWNEIWDWITNEGVSILGIIVIVGLSKPVINVVTSFLLDRSINKKPGPSKTADSKRKDTLYQIITSTAFFFVIVIGLLAILNNLGVDTTAMIAGLGVVGFAIGFGAQELVKDMIAGTFIILENQYRIGDNVELAGKKGKVVDITMRETVLRDIYGSLHHIPNGQIKVATNKSFGFSKVSMKIPVAYDTDLDKAAKVINEVGTEMFKDKDWKKDLEEAPKYLRVGAFGPSEVELRVTAKTKPGRQWAVAGEMRKRIKLSFDKNKIEIPFQQTVIHQAKDNK